MTSSLLISCDAFAALFVAPDREATESRRGASWPTPSWLAPARLGPAEHDPRAVATCRHPRFLRDEPAPAAKRSTIADDSATGTDDRRDDWTGANAPRDREDAA